MKVSNYFNTDANQQLDYDQLYNVRDNTESEEMSEDVNDDHELERFYRPRNRDLFNVFDNYSNQPNFNNIYNFFNLRRDNNYSHQMFNAHNLEDENDNYMDEIFFFNPNIDKSLKNENNAFFEENLTFPFMIFLLNDELGDFYRPDIYISVIHKIKKNHLYYLNVMFQYKFLCPFDRKMRKNIVFAVNGKDKTSNVYIKDFQKLETEFSAYYNDDLLKPYMSKLDSFENIQKEVLGVFNINNVDNSPNRTQDIRILEEGNKETDKNNNKKEDNSEFTNIKDEVKEENKEAKDQNDNNNELNKEENKEHKDINMENEDIEEEKKIEESNNNNFIKDDNKNKEPEEKEKQEKFNLEIDPLFLEQLPEDLAQEILQQQRTILNTNSNRAINQYYDITNIDQDILNELPEDIKNEIISANTSQNVPANANTNNNIDHATFFESLPRDIREEILINAPPDLLSNLPPDLMAEAQMLIERESNNRRLIFANHRRAPPDPLQINIAGDNIFNKNYEDEYVFSPPKYTFEETFVSQKYLKDLCNYFTSFFDDEFLENIITFNIKYTCEFSPKNKISTNHNWNLINNLMQNSNLRYKILDILFIVWIVDSLCLKDLIKINPNIVNQNNLLKNLNSIFLEGKLLEEFFYDDFDRKLSFLN